MDFCVVDAASAFHGNVRYFAYSTNFFRCFRSPHVYITPHFASRRMGVEGDAIRLLYARP